MNDHIKKKVAEKFSQRELAMLMSTKQQSVSRWFNSKFPASRVLHLCQLMQWEVVPHELRPDIYPNPTDGLPVGCKANTSNASELIHENQA
ncbi:transcriptional regulator [Escherichia coli]|uniref:transcriptional regulator n=1 Tax=Escherichia coli TaxID=562 RepID=UPI000BB87CFB|nr:YdaS family helix-turn-helix protein [Escherichia coli]